MKRCLGCHGIAISEDLFVFELTELAKRARQVACDETEHFESYDWVV